MHAGPVPLNPDLFGMRYEHRKRESAGTNNPSAASGSDITQRALRHHGTPSRRDRARASHARATENWDVQRVEQWAAPARAWCSDETFERRDSNGGDGASASSGSVRDRRAHQSRGRGE